MRPAIKVSPGVVWDNHACLPLRPNPDFMPQLERYRKSGVDVVSINVGFGQVSWETHLRVLSYFRHWIGQRPEQFRLIQTVEDIRLSRRDGTLGICFDIEGMCPVIDQPSFVETFYKLGVRWMLIAYNQANGAGGGCLEADGGLTARGREIIAEMEAVGMVLCVSHTGERTALEAIECSKNPVIMSHSNPAAVTPHVRNASDHLIRKCAATGGVIGLSGIGPYLGNAPDLVDQLVTQIRHVSDLVGPSHVGLGLDYVFDRSELDEYVKAHPEQFPPDVSGSSAFRMIEPEQTTDIAERLLRANFTDAEVQGILGENWLTVAGATWR